MTTPPNPASSSGLHQSKGTGQDLAHPIGILSGKGGTGKTGICISIGQVLSAIGHNVLIVDLDAATLGMTHYLAPRIRDRDSGLMDKSTRPSNFYVNGEDIIGTLDFLPLTGDLLSSREFDIEQVADHASSKLYQWRTKYDYILLDFQAGDSPVMSRMLDHISTVLCVTEADPVSIGAVSRLRRSLSNKYRGEFLGVVNRIMPEESQYFQALVDQAVTDVRFLEALPFDSDLRRTFFRRENPIDLDNLGPFGIALFRALSRILPKEAESLSELSRAEQQTSMPVETLLAYRSQVEYSLSESLRQSQRQRIQSELPVIMFLLIIVAGLAVLTITKYSVQYIVVVVAIVAAALSLLFTFIARRRVPRDNTARIEALRSTLRDVEERLLEYELTGKLESISSEMDDRRSP